MMLLLLIYATAAASAATASTPGLRKLSNLVTFGDSYTDEGRLNYIFSHNALPPPGELLPVNNATSVGGYAWPRLVAQKTGAKLYDYAVAGGMCSDSVTQHFLSNINGPFPSILDYEVPAFRTDLGYRGLYPDRRPDNTAYALWIGTNDLGIDGFLGDKQVRGATIPDFVECVWKALDGVYRLGGRHFVLLNVLPLQLSPMYASVDNGGTGNNEYWGNKATYNTTETQDRMEQYLSSANSMFATGAPYNLLVKRRWPGATVSLLDVHSLLLDLRADPTRYYTEPVNITGSWRGCGDAGCWQSTNPQSSFVWYDEVHPSERTCEHVADEFIKLLDGRSRYGVTYR